jgi:succinate dehydrogenase / fumarate reductase iron-sulfur subunit
MKINLKIKRYDPEKDAKPYWKRYTVEVEPTDRVLDALHEVKWNQDGTLALRRSCAHGICGSDAMRINGPQHAGLQSAHQKHRQRGRHHHS